MAEVKRSLSRPDSQPLVVSKPRSAIAAAREYKRNKHMNELQQPQSQPSASSSCVITAAAPSIINPTTYLINAANTYASPQDLKTDATESDSNPIGNDACGDNADDGGSDAKDAFDVTIPVIVETKSAAPNGGLIPILYPSLIEVFIGEKKENLNRLKESIDCCTLLTVCADNTVAVMCTTVAQLKAAKQAVWAEFDRLLRLKGGKGLAQPTAAKPLLRKKGKKKVIVGPFPHRSGVPLPLSQTLKSRNPKHPKSAITVPPKHHDTIRQSRAERGLRNPNKEMARQQADKQRGNKNKFDAFL